MFQELLQNILGSDLHAAGIIILNLILIESLLSIDNAAVLATMVMDLPPAQRSKALRIGIIFAYIFRGLALLFASILIKITWLKLIGAIYLIYMSFSFFFSKKDEENHDVNINDNRLFRYLKPILGAFWSTVVMVELMDLVFSIDNVFAAVVYAKDNIYLIWIGVFIGIITMRLVAVLFVKLMEKFPLLHQAAFVVIGLLGIKLFLSFCCGALNIEWICELEHNKEADFTFSLVTLLIFVIPLLFARRNARKENQ